MPRILSAALNGLGLDTMQTGGGRGGGDNDYDCIQRRGYIAHIPALAFFTRRCQISSIPTCATCVGLC